MAQKKSKLKASKHPKAQDIIPPIHLKELRKIFDEDRRIPTVSSRNAWALARNIDSGAVSRWWARSRAVARQSGALLSIKKYDLPVYAPQSCTLGRSISPSSLAQKNLRSPIIKPEDRGSSPATDVDSLFPSSPVLRFSPLSSPTPLDVLVLPETRAYTPSIVKMEESDEALVPLPPAVIVPPPELVTCHPIPALSGHEDEICGSSSKSFTCQCCLPCSDEESDSQYPDETIWDADIIKLSALYPSYFSTSRTPTRPAGYISFCATCSSVSNPWELSAIPFDAGSRSGDQIHMSVLSSYDVLLLDDNAYSLDGSLLDACAIDFSHPFDLTATLDEPFVSSLFDGLTSDFLPSDKVSLRVYDPIGERLGKMSTYRLDSRCCYPVF